MRSDPNLRVVKLQRWASSAGVLGRDVMGPGEERGGSAAAMGARGSVTMRHRRAFRTGGVAAARDAGEPLRPEAWEVAWRLHEKGFGGALAAIFRALPSSPRCGICGAPLAGLG